MRKNFFLDFFFRFIEICSLIFNKGIWHAAYGRREKSKKENTIEKKVKDEKRRNFVHT